MEKIIELKIKKEFLDENKEDISIEWKFKKQDLSFWQEKLFLDEMEESKVKEIFINISRYFMSYDFLLFFKEKKETEIKVSNFLKIDNEITTQKNWKEYFVKNFESLFQEEIKNILEVINENWDWLSKEIN